LITVIFTRRLLNRVVPHSDSFRAESRMKCANAIKLDRKSGHAAFVVTSFAAGAAAGADP
jgi:hypothetical protein